MGRHLSFLLLLLSLTLSVHSLTGSKVKQPQTHENRRESQVADGEPIQMDVQHERPESRNEFGVFSLLTDSIQKFAARVGSMFSSSDKDNDVNRDSPLVEGRSRGIHSDHVTSDVISYNSNSDKTSLDNTDQGGIDDTNKPTKDTIDSIQPLALSESTNGVPLEHSAAPEDISKHSEPSQTKEEDPSLEYPREKEVGASSIVGPNRRLLFWFFERTTPNTTTPEPETESTDVDTFDPDEDGSGDQGVTIVTFPTDDEDEVQKPRGRTTSIPRASRTEETPTSTTPTQQTGTPASTTPDDTFVTTTPISTTEEGDTTTPDVIIEGYDTKTSSPPDTEDTYTPASTKPTSETEEDEDDITIDDTLTSSTPASTTTTTTTRVADGMSTETIDNQERLSKITSTPAFNTRSSISPTTIFNSVTPLPSTSLHGNDSTPSSVTKAQDTIRIAPSPTVADTSSLNTHLDSGAQFSNETDSSNVKTPTTPEATPVVSRGKAPDQKTKELPRPRRPSYEYVDLSTRSVYYLRSYYSRCDTCMEKWTSNRSRSECPTYANQVMEFEKWAREFANILRYGCGGPGLASDSRCCHGPQRQVSETISQMAQVSRTLTTTLRSQCSRCPVDCVWDEWSAWSQCPPPTCEGLPRNYRTRTRAAIKERYGGRGCGGADIERQACSVTPRVIGTWHDWGPWSACSGSCSGIQTRNRTCTDPTICFTPCPGSRLQWRECGDDSLCCALRQWTIWGAWSSWMSEPSPRESTSASSELTVAARTRRRTCDVDRRRAGQMICPNACPGEDLETEKCVESIWSEWGKWSACTSESGQFDFDTGEPCGTGFGRQSRTRTCRAGTCGTRCVGESEEYNSNCYLRPCCEPPVWTEWGDWGQCTDDGYQLRRRMCHADPSKWKSPTCSRRPCQGSPEERQRCDVPPQALTACSCTRRQWSGWGEWSPCGTEPGQSTRIKTRHRKCEGDPMSGQPLCPNACPGDDLETESCCTASEWGHWSSWSPCSSSTDRRDHDTGEPCGNGQGYQNRTRVCIPGTCGLRCEGQMMENNMDCYVKPCCELPQLSDWGQWEECSGSSVNVVAKSVRSRVQSRHRSCQPNQDKWESPVCRRNTACNNGGLAESRYCKCEIPEWSSWEPWTRCNFKEAAPSRSRIRSCNNPSHDSPECVHMCCAGANTQKQPCLCEKARYTGWGSFKDCKYNAGYLMMRRYRTCRNFDNPDYCKDAPYSWRHCVGRLMQEVPCCQSYWTEWKPNGKCYTDARGGHARFTARHCLWKEDCSSNLTKRLRPRCSGPSLDLIKCTPRQSRRKRSVEFLIAVPENECEGRVDGTFASQRAGCDKYVVCLNGLTEQTEECESHLLFDSVCQGCVALSDTCDPTQSGLDINRFVTDTTHLKMHSRRNCERRIKEAKSFLRHLKRRKREARAEEQEKK